MLLTLKLPKKFHPPTKNRKENIMLAGPALTVPTEKTLSTRDILFLSLTMIMTKFQLRLKNN
jgi:hypothetical protein